MPNNKYDIELIADGVKSTIRIGGVDMSHCVSEIDYHGQAGGYHAVTLRFVSTAKVKIKGITSITAFGSQSVKRAFVAIEPEGTEKSPLEKIIIEGKS